MKAFRGVLAAACLAAAAATMGTSADAHHSFGHYNMTATAEITGTVLKWEWGNPHTWLFVDVMNAGKVTTYGFELRSPGEMMRAGWKRTSVKVGDKVTVSFRPMKDGSPAGLMQTVKDANGKLIGLPRPGPGPA